MIELVSASAQDALLVAKTRKTVWAETYRGIFPDSMLDGYSMDAFSARDRQRIESGEHRYFLFMDGPECAGYFSFGPSNYGKYRDFALCLNNLYIRNEYTGRGLGRRAFDMIRKYCTENGISKFFCGCNANNLPAVAFYHHMGGIPGDSPRTDVPKEDQIIHFEFYLGERL